MLQELPKFRYTLKGIEVTPPLRTTARPAAAVPVFNSQRPMLADLAQNLNSTNFQNKKNL